MKKANSRRALALSLLSLLLCASMLIGTTFAWFTDSASTAVNTIQAGTLDVALEMSTDNGTTWENAEGKTLDFIKKDGATEILWEPGCTYQLPMLRVINNGDLKLKFKVAITGITGDAKLNEAIQWSGFPSGAATTLDPDTASAPFTIEGHMKEEAGNEYQGLTIEGIAIAVYATQVEGEFDSYSNDYDATAPLPSAIIDTTFYASLQEAVDAALAIEGGATVKLSEDAVLTRSIAIPEGKTLGLDLNGHVISGTCAANQGDLFALANTATLILDDSVGSGKITYDGNNSTGWIITAYGDLIMNGGTLELTGTWSIGYAVDLRPNAWGTAYTAPSTFTMNGGKIESSDGAVRVASSSSETYPDVSAAFTMNGGIIDAAWDGIFIQQSNAIWDVLSVTVNAGTINSDLNPVRIYGPAPTGYVKGDKCITLTVESGAELNYTGEETRSNWLIDGILRYGGGATAEEILADTVLSVENELEDGSVVSLGADGAVALSSVANVEEEEYTVPETVTSLGNAVFSGNTDITKVTVPAGVTYFGASGVSATGASGGAFKGSQVTEIVLEEGMTEIPAAAFNGASKLTSVSIPSTVHTIGVNAFRSTAITELVIPATVTNISYGAFRDMTSLTKVTFEGSHVDIPNYAFRGCTNLREVYINADTATIGTNTAFSNASSNNSGTNNITFYVKTNDIADQIKTSMGVGSYVAIYVNGALYAEIN